MTPKLIENRFKKCLPTYDESASVQKTMAQKLVSLSEKKDFEAILEIGCGTGLLTKECLEAFSFTSYLANDIVPECKDYVMKLNDNIEFIAGDITNLALKGKFDLIISNAVFQWFKEPEFVIEKLSTFLTPNGLLLYSTFGDRNFYELKEILGIGIDYPISYSKKLCEELYEMEFSSVIDLLKHIKNTGVNAIQNYSFTRGDLKAVEKMFIERYGKVKLTYNPVYVSCLAK